MYWVGEKQLAISDYALSSLWYDMIGQIMFATLPIVVIFNSVIVGIYYRTPNIIVFIFSGLFAYALDQAYAVYAKMPNVIDDFTDLPRAYRIASTGSILLDSAISVLVWFMSSFGLIVVLAIVGWSISVLASRSISLRVSRP